MKKFEELLLSTIRNDIDYLFQEVYLPSIRGSKKYLHDKYFAKRFENAVNKDKYDLKDISIMSGGSVTESYMLDLIKKFCDDSILFSAYDEVSRISLIPMFKYFMDKDINNARLMGAFFLPIHCSGQMTNIFLNDKASTRPIFNVSYTLVSGIDHSLGSRDSRFDLGSAMYYLNFINYEKRNMFARNNSEYFNKLNDISLELEKVISFYGSDDLLDKYDTIKNGLISSKDGYNDNDLVLSSNNLKLIQYFYGESLPSYPNKAYELKQIEESLATAANKKDLLLASFCYRKYSDDEFFKNFDDVELDVNDIFNFISECERANLKITNRQVGNLIESFKKYYLVKNNLVEDYEKEKSYILEAYDRYCARNWTFEKTDFINFFNSLYGKEFKTFGFDSTSTNSSLLTPEILDEVIGNNKFVGLERIKDTNTGVAYFSSCSQTAREKYCCDIEHRRDIFKRYYDLTSEYCSAPKITMHYFIYRIGASAEDEKEVEELIDWCCVNSNFNSDFYSEELKKNTDKEIREKFKGDLLANFRSRREILNRHLSIINRDDIVKYGTAAVVKKIESTTRKEQFSKLTDSVVKRAEMAIDGGLTGWDAFSDINLSQNDIRSILIKNGVDWRKFGENNNIRLEFCSQMFKSTLMAVTEYASSDLSIMDICNKYGCLPESMTKCISSYMDTDPELFKKFHHKVIENNECIDNSYINVDNIAAGIVGGVIMPNGKTRKYTFFDLMMDVGHYVNLYEIKKLLDKSYPNDYFIGNFLSVNPSFSSVHYSYDLRKAAPFSRQIRGGVATVNVDGEQHLITDEERETVLGFLERHDWPSCLYYDAVKAYLNKEFDPNEKAATKKMIKKNDKKSEN